MRCLQIMIQEKTPVGLHLSVTVLVNLLSTFPSRYWVPVVIADAVFPDLLAVISETSQFAFSDAAEPFALIHLDVQFP